MIHGGKGRKLAGVGVNFGRQVGIAVTHELLRQALGYPTARQQRRKGIAECMKVHFPTNGVHNGNSCLLKVLTNSALRMNPDKENCLFLTTGHRLDLPQFSALVCAELQSAVDAPITRAVEPR
nr:hypothetical protein [Cerasicoccus arenae]